MQAIIYDSGGTKYRKNIVDKARNSALFIYWMNYCKQLLTRLLHHLYIFLAINWGKWFMLGVLTRHNIWINPTMQRQNGTMQTWCVQAGDWTGCRLRDHSKASQLQKNIERAYNSSILRQFKCWIDTVSRSLNALCCCMLFSYLDRRMAWHGSEDCMISIVTLPRLYVVQSNRVGRNKLRATT